MTNDFSFSRLVQLTAQMTGFVLLLLLLLLFSLSGCRPAEAQTHDIPTLKRIIESPYGINEGVLHPNRNVYFMAQSVASYVSVFSGTTSFQHTALPSLGLDAVQILFDIEVEPHSGLVYIADMAAGAIYVISGTAVLTTLTGIGNSVTHLVADQDAGEVYAFYIVQDKDGVHQRTVVLSGTQVITDMLLPFFVNVPRYNPVDGYIYLEGGDPHFWQGQLVAINNHRVITSIPLLENEGVRVADMAINPSNGDIYLLMTIDKVKYWDRQHEMRSIDLLALGHRHTQCITVDPKHGWAYVCEWAGHPSRILVIDKDQLVATLPVPLDPKRIAVDRTHDYLYVTHQRPGLFSVIRDTTVITTLPSYGAGPADMVVNEADGLIYVSNPDSHSVTVFGFEDKRAAPPLWPNFLPLIQREQE